MDNGNKIHKVATLPTKTVDLGGRPSSITPEVVLKLIAVFQRGLSVTTALSYAKISKTAFYERYRNDQEFRDKIDDAKDFGKHIAGSIIIDTLTKSNNEVLKAKTAQWYLERKEPSEYGRKPEVEVNNNTTNQYLFVSDEEFKRRAELAGVTKLNPAAIAQALETQDMGRGVESTPIVEVDQGQLGNTDTNEKGVSKP